MKFEDITPFTRNPSYQVNISLVYLQDTINEYITQHGLNMDSDFQRPHVWPLYKRERFVEFILKGGSSARILYFNHPGWMGSFDGEFVLVDGKQRLTSLLMFLNNEIRAFGYYYKEYEDKIDHLKSIIFSINDLKTKAEVLQWYLDLNDGGIVHTQKELDKVRYLLKLEKNKQKEYSLRKCF